MEYLQISEGDTIIDATLGLGGHSKAILKKIGTSGILVAFDWDVRNRKIAEKNLKSYKNKIIIGESFSHICEECKKRDIQKVKGILFDLGISSAHLDDESRGFSYRFSSDLDLRMDTRKPQTAAEVLNTFSEEDLRQLFWKYGEERQSRALSQKIVEVRNCTSITKTDHLFQIISEISKNPKKTASRVFQALRIFVNQELKEIESALPQAFEILQDKGRVAVISFHSLEDRIVKNFFREQQKNGIGRRVNNKVVTPSRSEMEHNPRSRSAKLRVFEKVKIQKNKYAREE